MKKRTLISLLASSLFGVAAMTYASNVELSVEADTSTPDELADLEQASESVLTPTGLELVLASEELTTLAAALKAANLISPLQGEVPFTLFAPTDAAFAAIALDVAEEWADQFECRTHHDCASTEHTTDTSRKQQYCTVDHKCTQELVLARSAFHKVVLLCTVKSTQTNAGLGICCHSVPERMALSCLDETPGYIRR